MHHRQFRDALNEYVSCDFSLQFIAKDQTHILPYVSAMSSKITMKKQNIQYFTRFLTVFHMEITNHPYLVKRYLQTEFQDVLSTTKKVKFNLI
jgi:hypothetical protein